MVKTKLGCKTFSQVANFRIRSKFNFVYFFYFNVFERNHFFFIKDKKNCTVLVCLLLVKWLRTLRYSVVANFCNCCENSGLRNFATSEISQVVKFRNLRNLRRL